MRRPVVLAAAAAAGVLGPAAAAHGASLTLDRSCYTEQTQITATGAGFTPGAPVTLTGGAEPLTVTADATGAFAARVQAPLNPSDDARRRALLDASLTAQDGVTSASTPFQVTNFAFRTTAGVASPSRRRTWTFTGFDVGQPIYVHFRHRGRTVRTFRMGRARGPCGALTRRAPLIPVRAPVARGKWTIQVDGRRAFRRTTQPRIRTSVTVFATYRTGR